MSRLRARARNESGSALVLALIFLSVCGITVGALMTYANTGSSATTALRTARGNDYDTDGAMQAAIATERISTTPCGTGLTVFTPLTTNLNNSARPIRVDCILNNTAAPVTGQRHYVLLVCPTGLAVPCPATSTLLRADVIFYDTPSTGASIGIQTWSNQ